MMDIDIEKLVRAAAEGLDLSKFKGDVVGVKIVENEIGNVEEGGIGIKNEYYSSNMEEFPADRIGGHTDNGLTFTSKYDGKKLLTVYHRLKDDYVTCTEETWLYLWGVFVHPVKKVTIDRPEKPAVWSAMRGKKSALMEMVRALVANDCGEILKKTAKWFVFSDGTIPDPEFLKSYELNGKSKTEFLQLVTVH